MTISKTRIVLFFFSIIWLFSVEAASLSIECNNLEVELDSNFSCNLNIEYENETIKEISFDYTSPLDISYGNNISVQNNHATITFTEFLVATTKTKASLGKVNVHIPNTLASGNYSFSLNNINYLNASDVYEDILDTSIEVKVLPLAEDCRLSAITINGEVISGFNADIYTYNVVVHTQSVFIDAIRIGDKVNITGLGTVRVREGKTVTREIIASDARGNMKKYTLNISNVPETNHEETPSPTSIDKSGDNFIKDMAIYYEGNKLDFKYDSTKTSFTYTIRDNTIEKVTIQASLNDNKAMFDDLYCPREVEIAFGTNSFEILVIAENQDLKVYTLNIIREDYRDSDNSLASIKVNNRDVELLDDKYNYEISTSNTISLDDIEALAKSDKAKITYREILLPDGESGFNITVTAENGEEQDYSLILHQVDSEELENIQISNYSLGFNSKTYSYDLTLLNDEEKLDIRILPNNLKYEIIGNENLKDGSKVTIKYNHDGETKEYVINIHKESKVLLPIVCYLTFGVGLVLFTLSIIYYWKKTKK